MHPELRLAFDAELAAAQDLYRKGQLASSFRRLERAHVLGQGYVGPHVRSHWWMMKIGWRRASVAEIAGQAVRIVLGALGSALGVVPTGNTGGTDVSMFRRMKIDEELRQLLMRNKG